MVRQAHHERVPEESSNVKDFEMISLQLSQAYILKIGCVVTPQQYNTGAMLSRAVDRLLQRQISLGAVARWLFKPRLPLALVAILAVSLALRLYGLNWDGGALYHPDERAIVWQGTEFSGQRGVSELGFPNSVGEFFSVKSPLNPHWFPYGSFPLYVTKAVAWVFSPLLGPYDLSDYAVLGRAINAFVDTATVLLVYLLGTRLYSRRVGLLASAFTAFAVLHIQQSHFAITDIYLAFFAVLTVFFLARVMERGDPRSALLAGLALGLGLASKVALAPMAFTVVVAFALYAFFPGREVRGPLWAPQRVQVALGGLLLTFGAAGLAFVVAQPYAIIDWRTFRDDVDEQSKMVRRILDYPYTLQYVNTIPYWYHIEQFAAWSAGPFLGVASWLGLVFTGASAFLRRYKPDILVLSWLVPYLLITGWFDVKFQRYLLPASPFLFLLASRMLFSAYDWLKAHRQHWWPVRRLHPGWVAAAGGLVLVATAFYAIAYVRIYSQPHSAERMAAWVNANVPKDSVIGQTHWEEWVRNLQGYRYVELPLYNGDGPPKRDQLIGWLENTDYILFYSNRLYGSIPRVPERYPVTGLFFEQLFAGNLGFELAHWEATYPNLFGVSFVDDTFSRPGLPTPPPLRDFKPSAVALNLGFADESYSVYDHPLVILFKRVKDIPREEMQLLLQPSEVPLGPLPLTYSAEDAARQQTGGTWSKLFDRQSFTNRLPEVAWLLVIELIFLVALPLGLVLFRALPDRGYLLTKAFSILMVAYVPWLLASFKWMAFSRDSIAVGILLVAALSTVALAWRREEIFSFVRRRWRLILASEVLFLAAFGAFYSIRLANPDLWHPFRGGEKPMDFAYLNAVIRSDYMPPYDPWFAGGYLNYYYFGQFITATLVKFSGVVPSMAYNLAVPLFFALTFGALFSIGYNLAAVLTGSHLVRERRFPVPPAWVAGLLVAAFVLVLGNLDGMVQLGQGLWDRWTDGQSARAFDYWKSTRLMPPDPPGFEINEFPFFTFLFADLHAHLINLPFTVLSVGLGLALVLGAKRGLRDPQNLVVLLALDLTLGAMSITNSWDSPTYLLLAAAAGAIALYLHRPRFDLFYLALVVLVGGAVYGLGLLLFLPFHANYTNFYTGLDRVDLTTSLDQYLHIHGLFIFVVLSFLAYLLWHAYGGRIKLPFVMSPVSGGGDGGAAVARGTSGTALSRDSPWLPVEEETEVPLIHVGAPVFEREAEQFWLPVEGIGMGAPPPRKRWLLLATLLTELGAWWRRWALYGVPGAAFLGALAALLSLGYHTVTFLALLLLATGTVAVQALRRREESTGAFLLLLAFLGIALVLGISVDFFRVEGDIDRMNTVFKFYLQAWVLFGIVAGVGVWHLAGTLLTRSRRLALAWKGAWMVGLLLLVASASVYPVLGTRARINDRFDPSLGFGRDGTGYMRVASYFQPGPMELEYDRQAIRWLQENVEGSPVVLEAVTTDLYTWSSRVSVYTGLPDVIGWGWHQMQQRAASGRGATVEEQRLLEAIRERQREGVEMFNTLDAGRAMELLRKYNVRYIYVGQLERLLYDPQGLAKFEGMAGDELELVYPNAQYSNPQVAIYRVR
jgi:uncharacterized membrane protein/4-amino-4-deoxy-L-arabinose transferase-like glycosyltransferase